MKHTALLILFCPALLSAQSYQWAFPIGAGQNDVANAIVLDASGNSYVAGHFSNTVDFDPGSGTSSRVSNGGKDIFVASYDAAGNFRWVSAMGSNQDDDAIALACDNNGHVNITGNFIGSADANPGTGVQLLTATASGTFVWQLDMSNGGLSRAFAIDGFSAGYGLAVDASGNVIITGVFDATTDFDPSGATASVALPSGSQDIYVAKYDNNFSYQWAFALGGSSSDQGHALACDAAGNIYAGGYCSSTIDLDPGNATSMTGTGGAMDGWLASYDPSGAFRWGFGLRSAADDQVRCISVNGSTVYVGGNFSNTVDFDPAGPVANQTSGGSTDLFFASYSTGGAYQWAKHIGAGFDDSCEGICTDPNGDVYITGDFDNAPVPVDFDPGSGFALVSTYGAADVFVGRYTSQGNYVWAFSMGSTTAGDIGTGIAADNGYVFVAGFFAGNVDFDPSGSTTAFNGAVADGFVAKYATPFVGIEEHTAEMFFSAYPNPVNGNITINSNRPLAVISVFDNCGKMIRQEKTSLVTGDIKLDCSKYTPGMYLLQVTAEDGAVAWQRFIVQ